MLPLQAVIICVATAKLCGASLLFPDLAVLQLTSSVSVPITDLAKHHRINFDWGFQMNYALPYNLSLFYNASIWPTDATGRMARGARADVPARHSSDFSAGELYRGLERLLQAHGYAESCLLRCVCELAQQPFDAAWQGHVLTQLITFVLTPSWHRGFAAHESHYRRAYEAAELSGLWGVNCAKVYNKCRRSPLHVITNVIYDGS